MVILYHVSLQNFVLVFVPLLTFGVYTAMANATGKTIGLTMIDGELPNSFMGTAVAASGVVIIGALISATPSYFPASMPIVLGAVYTIQKIYLRTARQICLFGLRTKAPLYSHFAETLSGLISIRTFGWVDNFREQNLTLLDENQKPYYLLFCIQKWLQVVLDLVISSLTVLSFVVVQLWASINYVLVGLGLTLCPPI